MPPQRAEQKHRASSARVSWRRIATRLIGIPRGSSGSRTARNPPVSGVSFCVVPNRLVNAVKRHPGGRYVAIAGLVAGVAMFVGALIGGTGLFHAAGEGLIIAAGFMWAGTLFIKL